MTIPTTLNNRVHTRKAGSTSRGNVPFDYTILGWFHNRQNVIGWIITELSDYDREWIESKGVSTEGVYRSFTVFSDHQNLVRLNFETGTYAFVDNDHLLATDELQFQRATKFTEAWLDLN